VVYLIRENLVPKASPRSSPAGIRVAWLYQQKRFKA